MVSLPLAPDAPLSGLNGSCLKNFWQLPISKEFDFQPEYYIGQQVLHKIKVDTGEILHPVQVVGVCWTGMDWEYTVWFAKDHPQFVPENSECACLDYWQLEAM